MFVFSANNFTQAYKRLQYYKQYIKYKDRQIKEIKLTTKLIEKKSTYKCKNCGFDAKMLHWHCPSCKHWESIQPIFGVAGE